MISQLQSLMSSQPFSGLASELGAGQDVPGGSASSTGSGAAPSVTAATPSSQLSPDLLSSLISAQANASSDTTDSNPLSQLLDAATGHHHHHHGSTQSSQTNSASSTSNAPSATGQSAVADTDSDADSSPASELTALAGAAATIAI
jgi:hypothetical protein